MLEAILEYPFMRNALIGGLLAALACGVIGSYISVKKMTMVTGGIAHASFGGVGLGYFLGLNPVMMAFVFTIASALTMGMVTRRKWLSEEAGVGILWSIGMALGTLFIGLTPGFHPDLFSYLFGDILMIGPSDLWLMLGLDFVIIAVVGLFFNDLLAISFDEEFAQVSGIPSQGIYLMLLGLIALMVVVLIRAVGIIMVIAIVTIPTAIARHYVHRLRNMMILSSLLGALFIVAGLWLSYVLDVNYGFNIASGATIVLLAGIGFLISLGLSHLRARKRMAVAKNGS